MANEPRPDAPHRSPEDTRMRDPAPLAHEFQADPELTEGPASRRRIAIAGLAIAVVLGLVFYGLNSASMAPSTPSTSTVSNPKISPNAPQPGENVAEQSTRPPDAPGVRDVTPYNNQPGVTTGAAPMHPRQQAPGGTR